MSDASRPDPEKPAQPSDRGNAAPKPDPSPQDEHDAERQARAKEKAAKDRNEDG